VIYLFETKIDPKLTVEKGLTKIFGIGKFRSEEILNLIGIQKRTLFKDISKNEISRIKKNYRKRIFRRFAVASKYEKFDSKLS
jgi:ribosomal protein S13